MQPLFFSILAGMLVLPAGGAMGQVPACLPPASQEKAIHEAQGRLVTAAVLLGDMADPGRQAGPVTRGEFATVLVRALGWSDSDLKDQTPSFPDTVHHPAAQAVAALEKQGIVRGYPGGAFGPDNPVTLLQVKVMIARALRAAPDPQAAAVDEALRGAGVEATVLCSGDDGARAAGGHVFLLLDRAMSAMLYGRHGAPAGLYDSATRTGVPEVDRVIDVVMKRGGQGFEDLVAFTEATCTTHHTSPGDVPCYPGEADGTKVNVFGIGACSPNSVRSTKDAADYVKAVVSSPLFLHSVWKADQPGWPTYGIVLTPALHDYAAPRLYLNAEGKIIQVVGGCGEASTVHPPGGATYLLGPKQ